MKKALILILVLASITRSHAQNPGYLGKHVMLTYNLHTMPRTGALEGYYMNTVDFEHEIQASMILNRFLMVNAKVQYSTSKKYTYNAFGPMPGVPDEQIVFESPLKFTNIAIGAGFSRYNILGPGPLAPIGNYLKGHLMLNSFHITDTAGQYAYRYEQSTTFDDFKRQDAYGIGLAAGVGFGRTRMIGETVVIDYGLESDWTFLKIVSSQNAGEHYDRSQYRELAGEVLAGQTLSIRLGIGGLLF